MAPKPKPASERRTSEIKLLLTANEFEEIKGAATDKALPPAIFSRQAVLAAARKEGKWWAIYQN